jgi:hypothetical protein
MTCLEVREQMAEYTLGLLQKPAAHEIERHLAWCPGCRKESGELLEGAASLGFSLPQVEPHPSLEWRIVGRLTGTQNSRKPSRRGFRVLVAATLAAMLGAVGAMSWAIAERNRVESIKATIVRQVDNIAKLQELLKSFENGEAKARHATLVARPGFRGASGLALIYPTANFPDLYLVSMKPPDDSGLAPYKVGLLDTGGDLVAGGEFVQTTGGLLSYEVSGADLSKVTSIVVADILGRTVLEGKVSTTG